MMKNNVDYIIVKAGSAGCVFLKLGVRWHLTPTELFGACLSQPSGLLIQTVACIDDNVFTGTYIVSNFL